MVRLNANYIVGLITFVEQLSLNRLIGTECNLSEEQLRAISTLQEIFGQWTKNVLPYPRQNKAPRAPPKKTPKKEKENKQYR